MVQLVIGARRGSTVPCPPPLWPCNKALKLIFQVIISQTNNGWSLDPFIYFSQASTFRHKLRKYFCIVPSDCEYHFFQGLGLTCNFEPQSQASVRHVVEEFLNEAAFHGERPSPEHFMNKVPLLRDLFIHSNTAILSSAAIERLFSVEKDALKPKRSGLTLFGLGFFEASEVWGGDHVYRSFWWLVSPYILVLKQRWKFLTVNYFIVICRVYFFLQKVD